jgi:hypothetical protein
VIRRSALLARVSAAIEAARLTNEQLAARALEPAQTCYIERMQRILISCLLLLACEKSAPKEAAQAAPAALATGEGTRPPPAGPAPSATDPHAGMAPTPMPEKAAPTEPARAGGLTWEAPAPFVRRAPRSSMRVAEYGLASEPLAEFGVFYFGADQGGSVEANMTRWVGQFTQPDGSETKPKRSQRKVSGIEVELIEAHGVYSGGMAMPGAPAPATQPDAMLLGAIAKGPLGSVFFKLVGPRAALEGARGAFDGLVGSIRNTEQPAKP